MGYTSCPAVRGSDRDTKIGYRTPIGTTRQTTLPSSQVYNSPIFGKSTYFFTETLPTRLNTSSAAEASTKAGLGRNRIGVWSTMFAGTFHHGVTNSPLARTPTTEGSISD